MFSRTLYEERKGQKVAGILHDPGRTDMLRVEIISETSRLPFEIGDTPSISKEKLLNRDLLIENGWVYEKEIVEVCSDCKQEMFYNQKEDEYQCVICESI